MSLAFSEEMTVWPELLLDYALCGTLALAACTAVTIVYGQMLHRRPISECVPPQTVTVCQCAGFVSFLLAAVRFESVPWEWLGSLSLLVAMAPPLLICLRPDGHVKFGSDEQIGKFSAHTHYFGYLRLMKQNNGVRSRLEKFKRTNSAGLSPEEMEHFHSGTVVVLAPIDGVYPSKSLFDLRNDELSGVGGGIAVVEKFKETVGGSPRSYGEFSVHRVTSSGGKQHRYVALDKMGALGTLQKLQGYDQANFSMEDCKKHMKGFMDELDKIVAKNNDLKGQLTLVRYERNEHVGDAILTSIEKGSRPSWRP